MSDDDESNFIVITPIKEFPMANIQPMSVTLSYPILVIVVAADQIITWNFDTKVKKTLSRQLTYMDSVVLCSAISEDHLSIATGHCDSKGGEIVIWSMTTGKEFVSARTFHAVSNITFGKLSAEIYHSNPEGILFCSTITSMFRMIKISPPKEKYNFHSPLTALVCHKDYLYTSSSNGQIVFRLPSTDFSTYWTDEEAATCFCFCQVDGKTYLARAMNRNVVVSTIDRKDCKKYQFSKTPSSISILGEDSILVLFAGMCEMITKDRHFKKDVPKGFSLTFNDKIYICGQELLQLSLASVEQRVLSYCNEGNWEAALSAITSPEDVPNLTKLLDNFVASDKFDTHLLFTTVERLSIIDYICLMLFKEKKEQILKAFLAEKITKWPLNVDFIKELINITPDEATITEFIRSIEINLDWIYQLAELCFNKRYIDLLNLFAHDYKGDYFSQLLIAQFNNNYDKIRYLLNEIYFGQLSDNRAKMDGISFLKIADLPKIISFDPNHSDMLFRAIVSFAQTKGFGISPVINRIIEALEYDSIIWSFISPYIVVNQMKISFNVIPNIENHIFFSKTDMVERENLFKMLLQTYQITNYQVYLPMSRQCGFKNCEYIIIALMHDIDELIYYLVQHEATSFANELHQVIIDHSAMKEALRNKCKIFMSINPDEFCEEILHLNDLTTIHEICELLCRSKNYYWHLLSRIMLDQEFQENAKDEEITEYLNFLCKYSPNEVYSTLKALSNHLNELSPILQVCQDHGIVDATLYLCDLQHDKKRAIEFGKAALESALMTGDDEMSQVVVGHICTYLSSTNRHDDKNDVWLQFLEVFQMPMFANLENAEKLQSIVNFLGQFMDSMIRDFETSTTISKKFVKLFSFLPFKIAKPMIIKFFKSIREKNDFGGTFVEIKKYEAIKRQNIRLRYLTSGCEYESRRCPQCNKLLGQGDAYASHCGHVFHMECAKSLWCPTCCVPFDLDPNYIGLTQKEVEPVQVVEAKVINPRPFNPSIGSNIVRLQNSVVV